jgi:hypothetical protein
MKLTRSRRAGAVLTVAAGAMALVALAASPATASTFFCGAGRGLTADVAIQGAFWDAQGSAQSEGFYGECTIIGEPVVGTFPDPYFGQIVRASLNLTCEQ